MEAADLLLQIPEPYDTRRNQIVLLVGFGALIALLLALGGWAAVTLQRAAAADPEKTRAYLDGRRALGDARAALIATGGAMRSFLMDPEQANAAKHKAEAQAAWSQVRQLTMAYRPIPGSEAKIEPLLEELNRFDRTLEQVWAASPASREISGYEALAEIVTPGRDRLLAQLETLARADQTALNDTVRQTAASLRRLQMELWAVIVISALLGLTVAALAYRHFYRLERLADDRFRQARAAAERSEQLSHRLLSVQEQERKRLARELHDEVGQSLGALLVDLGQVRSEPNLNTPDAQARLASAVANGEHTVRIVRDISLLLRPSMLDELGLIPALHWQAREVTRRSGLVATVRADDEDLALDEELRTTVFRVVQEALQNAAKHSGARSAEVGIAARNGHLRVMIADNGKGFAPELARGMGLLGMEERVARLGGSLRVSSAPSQGTTITADFPLGPGTSNV